MDNIDNKKKWESERLLQYNNYNKERYLAMLQKRSNSNSWSQENQEEFEIFSGLMMAQIRWLVSDQYLKLFEQFVKNEISSFDFFTIFKQREVLNEEAVDFLESKLILLEIDKEALKFEEFLEYIYDILEEFSEGEEDAETVLNNHMQILFFEMKNYLKNFK